MSLRDDIDAYADTSEEELLTADGFDDAIIGIVSIKGHEDVIVYDREKVIDILMASDDDEEGMSREEANEHFDFNIGDAYMGERTPGFLWKPCPQ